MKQDYYLSDAFYDTSASQFARAATAEHRSEECFDRLNNLDDAIATDQK